VQNHYSQNVTLKIPNVAINTNFSISHIAHSEQLRTITTR
jgi:hypothetical protein